MLSSLERSSRLVLLVERSLSAASRRGRLALVEAGLLVGATTSRTPRGGCATTAACAVRARAQHLEALVVESRHDHRDVARALQDLAGASARAGREALHGDALVGVGGRDEELVGVHGVVGDGVRDGRSEDLADDVGGLTGRAGEDLARGGDVLAADEVQARRGPCSRTCGSRAAWPGCRDVRSVLGPVISACPSFPGRRGSGRCASARTRPACGRPWTRCTNTGT